MPIILPQGKQSYFDSAGAPLVGGKLYTFEAGSTTPKATYTDAGGATPNTNPVVLDARGEATVFWSGQYKVELRTAADALLWTVDNVGTASSNAGDIPYNPALSYAAGTVGYALNQRKAVFATGVAATDDAAIQAAIDAAPAGGVIDLFGVFASSAAKTLKPQIMLRNGGGARINHSNASTNCFQYVPGGILGFPGQIFFDSLQIYGPGTPGSGEVLGTLTWGNIKAGIFIDANAPLCVFRNMDVRNFYAGIVCRNTYNSRMEGGIVAGCRHGVMVFGESHNFKFDNPFIDACTLTAASVNYGAGQQILQDACFVGGAYQNSAVGIWLEGCQGATGVGTTYFEGNTTSDMLVGVNDGYAYNRTANFTKWQGLGTSSPCGTPESGWPGVNINMNSSTDVYMRGLGFYSGTPTTTPHIQEDGGGDRIWLEPVFVTSSSPYNFADPSRVVVERGGRTNYPRDLTNGLTYGTAGAVSPVGRGPWFGGGFSGRDSVILETLGANSDLLFRVPATGQIRFADAAMNEKFSVDPINNKVSARVPVTFPVYAVAALPTPGVDTPPGTRAFVNNATVTTFASIPVGGGANTVPVYVDGAGNWRIG